MDVTNATIADGDTFIIIDPPKDGKHAKFIHEPAWDNTSGIIPVYDTVERKLIVVCKVWKDIALDKNRVNIYYEDRVERYIDDGGLVPYGDTPEEQIVPWTDSAGQPLGLPFAHFRNRKKTRNIYGTSEVKKVLAPQDVLNRTFASMTMTSELTAFQRLAFIGMTASADISPGAVWEIVAKEKDGTPIAGIPKDHYVDIKVIEPGEIAPFVQQAQFTIEQISIISDTPIPSVMGGDSQSGEALKQREVGLVAKARAIQIVSGNVWEDAIMQVRKIEEAFPPSTNATAPNEINNIDVVWAEINVRDNAQVVANVMAASTVLDTKTILKELEPVMDFAMSDIDDIITAKKREAGVLVSSERRKESLAARRAVRVAPPTPGNGQLEALSETAEAVA